MRLNEIENEKRLFSTRPTDHRTGPSSVIFISHRDHVVTGFQHLQPRLVPQVGHLAAGRRRKTASYSDG